MEKINANTRVKQLLNVRQDEVIEALVQLNSNFSKLKNPILRNLLASRITIAGACKIANCKVSDFLNNMKQIGFEIEEVETIAALAEQHIDFNKQTITNELDVRPYLEQDQDPLKLIMAEVKKLKPGHRLKIINKFEPTPLIDLLVARGFSYYSEQINADLVYTWFEKETETIEDLSDELEAETGVSNTVFQETLHRFAADHIQYIDVRELEMPKPMLMILEHIESMQEHHLLYVYHKKIPMFLLPELRKRGLNFIYNQKNDKEVDLLIYKS